MVCRYLCYVSVLCHAGQNSSKCAPYMCSKSYFQLSNNYRIFQDSTEKDKKKKQLVKSVELPIESLTFGFSQVELNQYTEQEFKMIAGLLKKIANNLVL